MNIKTCQRLNYDIWMDLKTSEMRKEYKRNMESKLRANRLYSSVEQRICSKMKLTSKVESTNLEHGYFHAR